MAFQEKILFQDRPSVTTPVTAYQPTAGFTGIAKTIIVVNVGNVAGSFTIYIDPGTEETYSEDTAISWEVPIAKKTTTIIDSFLVIPEGGSLGIQTSNADDLNFTVMGAEATTTT